MSSCHSSTMLITPKTSFILRKNTFLFPNSTKFRCVLHQIVPKFVVSSSLSSLLTSGNVIAAAAAAAGSGLSRILSYYSSGRHCCCNCFGGLPFHKGSLVLDGVDVTGYTIFNDEKVQKAIAFARKAHHGQTRMTGDPYLSHCIHTAKILAVWLVPNGKRAIDTVVAGILHDVVDDTCESLHSIEREFGAEVAKLVGGVSRLSYVNQANNLRVMLLGMIDDPRVVLIKLADRLHNMRTIYALPSTKAQAVAQETLVIWCSLASRLGLWAVKAELEDLCFAVLQPKIFRQMRAELASMWSPINKTANIRKSSVKSSNVVRFHKCEEPTECDEENTSMKILLQAVLPFDLLLDRKKRVVFYKNLTTFLDTPKKPKVVRDAGIALASLVVCEEALERELFISTSYVPGMEVTLSGRLKSLYSIYTKHKRFGQDLVLNTFVIWFISPFKLALRFWTPIDGEFDDYIVNPKPSGYQRMHEYAEHGLAAHWLYKESENLLPSKSSITASEVKDSADFSKDMEDQDPTEDDAFIKYSSLKVGHPVLRVEAGHLLAAVIVRVDNGGSELLVAVSFGLAASEAVAERRSSYQIKRWEAYANLYKKVSDEWWCANLGTEIGVPAWKNTPSAGMQDQFQRLLPTFIQVIELTEREETEYWAVVSAVFEGKPIASDASSSSCGEKPSLAFNSALVDNGINNKVLLLRTMLQWEEQLRSEAGFRQLEVKTRNYRHTDSFSLGEVAIVCWPNGEIMRLRTGSTAADAARRIGFDGKLVSVNGQLVLPNTQLKDGDVVEVRM
ncbi:UNVERIFIED_CONTAM: putative GTP diphosphokinase RSH2, chloroplastic [Sesamum radiatum]|uniref:GTP diphosphokinase n=1 Tax=Sesamum radiatum TaxID=300843 RepID=A0AAW2KCG6_SESRA